MLSDAAHKRLRGQARRLLRDMSIPYTEVERIKDLGSSPGDIMWDGASLVIEHSCPPWWIVHEAAHLIEARRRGAAHLRNWGFDAVEEYEEYAPWQDWEAGACELTIALMDALKYPKWLIHTVADELAVLLAHRPFTAGSDFNPKVYCAWMRESAPRLLEYPAIPKKLRSHLEAFLASGHT